MLKPNTVIFLIALSTLAGVHFISLQLYLYWRYLWLDIPVHILGGAVVALGLFASRDLRIPALSRFVDWGIGFVLIFVICIMTAWELFELWAGIPILPNYHLDTAIDMSVGFLGGLLGFYVATNIDRL